MKGWTFWADALQSTNVRCPSDADENTSAPRRCESENLKRLDDIDILKTYLKTQKVAKTAITLSKA
jgi:hypothetical protein